MVTTAFMGVAVKTLMIVLLCLMVAAFAYLFVFGDYLTCFDQNASKKVANLRIFSARLVQPHITDSLIFQVIIAVNGGFHDIYRCFRAGIGEDSRVLANMLVAIAINLLNLKAWYAYKESSWIIAIALMVPMNFLGSIITIGYILTHFCKLSPEESSKDPLYFVLARRQKRDVVGHMGRHSIVTATVIYSVLGCVALGTLIYSVYVDLSPSHIKYFVSCFWTNGTDIYIHVVIFSVWVAYKESNSITAFFWILSIFCFRGLAICVYVVRQLSNLSPQQPASLIIFNNNTGRYMDASDPPLIVHPINV